MDFHPHPQVCLHVWTALNYAVAVAKACVVLLVLLSTLEAAVSLQPALIMASSQSPG